MTVTHALLLPAPLHDVTTACGLSLSDTQNSTDRISSDLDKVDCKKCLRMHGRRSPDWDNGLPTVQEFETSEDGQVAFSVAHVTAEIYLDAFRKDLNAVEDATNYVEWSFIDADGLRVLVTAVHPGKPSPHERVKILEAEIERLTSAHTSSEDD